MIIIWNGLSKERAEGTFIFYLLQSLSSVLTTCHHTNIAAATEADETRGPNLVHSCQIFIRKF